MAYRRSTATEMTWQMDAKMVKTKTASKHLSTTCDKKTNDLKVLNDGGTSVEFPSS